MHFSKVVLLFPVKCLYIWPQSSHSVPAKIYNIQRRRNKQIVLQAANKSTMLIFSRLEY